MHFHCCNHNFFKSNFAPRLCVDFLELIICVFQCIYRNIFPQSPGGIKVFSSYWSLVLVWMQNKKIGFRFRMNPRYHWSQGYLVWQRASNYSVSWNNNGLLEQHFSITYHQRHFSWMALSYFWGVSGIPWSDWAKEVCSEWSCSAAFPRIHLEL